MNKLILLISIFVIVSAVATTASVMSVQSVMAIAGVPCFSCAKDFSPGQEKNTAESSFDSGAKAFSPGQEAKVQDPACTSCNGKEFAPGQVKGKFIGQ